MDGYIQLRNVSKRFGSMNLTAAVNSVDMKVMKNDFTVLVGPSGSGKSTLLQMIGSLYKPDEGEILVDGIRVTDLRRNELADFRHNHVGIIFQEFHLLPSLTVQENILAPFIPRKGYKAYIEKAVTLMEELGIADKKDSLPNELSGGQQQRVAVARALMNDPAWILADEPTGNLDAETSTALFELLQHVHDEKHCGVLLVTHDLELASKANQVLNMKDGKVLV